MTSWRQEVVINNVLLSQSSYSAENDTEAILAALTRLKESEACSNRTECIWDVSEVFHEVSSSFSVIGLDLSSGASG